MTESEWLACADPNPMLWHLSDNQKASVRKSRLFTVACCRRVWRWLQDERVKRAVEVAEWYADGLVGDDKLTSMTLPWPPVSPKDERSYYIVRAIVEAYPIDAHRYTAALAYEATAWDALAEGVLHIPADTKQRELAAQADLLRDLFGSPFSPPPVLDPTVLAWNGAAVRHLAQAIYDERAFDRLPVLSDALEEAGCTDAELLRHCRGGGEHARGCWAVDLVLAKG